MLEMRIFLPWQLVVAFTLFLDASSESELPIPSTNPTLSATSVDKPLPTKFSSMQYGSACINIYDSRTTLNNKIIFFYSPIAQLNHKDTVFFFNQTANQGLISLSYSIWNEVVGIKVSRHLTQALNQEVEPNQVKVFPFDSVWLTSIAQSSGDFSLTNERLTYKDEQSLRFSLTCLTYEDCDQVKAKIRSNPEQFENLKLYFSPQWNDNYCFSDGVEISQEDELSIKLEELEKRLEETKLNFIKELTKTTQRMKSETTLTVESLSSIIVGKSEIFQESINASYVAMEILKTEQKETKKDLAAISQMLANKMNITEENLTVTFANLEATRNELTQTKTTVEELSAKLKGNSEILQKSVNASQVAVENLKTDQKETKSDLAAISQLLAIKMNVTEENLAVTFANLEATRNELTQTKTTVDELSAKLKGTKQELEQTKNDLIKSVDDLSTKLNSTKKELGGMKIIDENFSTELKVTKQKLEETKLEKTRDDLTNSVNYVATKLNSVEKKLAGMKIIDENFSTQLEANSRRLSYELKVAEENMRQELRATSNHLESTTTNLNRARTELSSTNAVVSDLTTKLNARTSEIVDIGKMPTSCSDLKRMGHKLSGFFSVKGSKKLETVFCDFYPNQNGKERWIGYVDVKSAPVHFFVQKNSSFVQKDKPIPFELSVLNVGDAMNLTSGIFTAPRKGIYYFSFTGNAGFPASSSDVFTDDSKKWRSSVYLRVRLYFNGTKMGVGNVQEANTVAGQHSPFVVQSTLELNSGDRVWLQMDGMSPGAVLHEDKDFKFNHFTGFILEEEIVASL
ncbi:E3 ubiquitin-protein ligase BRE1-like isoform X1 [Daphnia pulex]|uniref:E3 ubiquitin-protein ligase BRE1-like isoform X1 n=1 Tax=Daphnia pulex TaxID=6669 RepID=UPI001EDD31F5|nr:E3 ubiquitin-protein ligase BRE1-like isoform X1 [Daphnia pulex]